MSDATPCRPEDDPDGGHLGLLPAHCAKSPTPPAEKSPARRGRPRDDEGGLGLRARVARRRQRVLDRHRADCRTLAEAIAATHALEDKGAAGGSVAAAVGTLARATATLHELEADAYDLGGGADGHRGAVIVLPVAAETIAQWAAAAAGVLGVIPVQSNQDGPGGARRVYADEDDS